MILEQVSPGNIRVLYSYTELCLFPLQLLGKKTVCCSRSEILLSKLSKPSCWQRMSLMRRHSAYRPERYICFLNNEGLSVWKYMWQLLVVSWVPGF